ncbi:MAG: hypothetical protein Q9167_004130 [Letrouitia subvulpina]
MPSNTQSRASGSKNTVNSNAPKATSNGSIDKGAKSTNAKRSSASTSKNDQNSAPPPTSQTTQNEPQVQNGGLSTGETDQAPSVNRKKQKRREKQAARLAAEKQAKPEGLPPDETYREAGYGFATEDSVSNGYNYGPSDYYDPGQFEPMEGDDMYYTDDDGHLLEKQYAAPSNGYVTKSSMAPQATNKKSKKAKKNKPNSFSQQDTYQPAYPTGSQSTFHPPPPPPPPPPMSSASFGSTHHISKDRIWNTSTGEEKERIKEFWLSLGEEERRSLVKVEKEAVLKKMKEQQKHSCSCTVCGRKRTAIEEELEVLYDAYYEELEQYANHQPINLEDGAAMLSSTKLYHPMARMASTSNPPPLNQQRSSKGRIQEVPEDEDDGEDEEYSDEDEDEEYSEEELEEERIGPAANDFFNFGNSLTVQGGILTVADDLLKNDGKKFIEMMEQLAERRMQREEEAQYAATAGLSHPSMQSHNHGPPLEDDAYDDEEEEEEDSYDSQDDEDYEEDDMDQLTEEQRMEEGRRMFQIFAARMFEQRVLTAYREKVAAERQQKLIEELEEESRLDTQREAKRAKEAQKKKDKKRQQKQAKEEEKARKEAEKAADEAAARALEEKKQEEQRQKKEEQRKKREAEKKAQEEEKQRKEAEKQRRLQEAREQQAELERRQREQKEREKKKREEVKRKEREEREAKEKEIRERKECEAADRRERDARAKAQQEQVELAKKEEQQVKVAASGSQTSSSTTASSNPALPSKPSHPNRQPTQTKSGHASPHLQIATPVVPKAPSPARPRQPSYQDSHAPSPRTTHATSSSSTTSPSLPAMQHSVSGSQPGRTANQTPSLQSQPSLPNPSANNTPNTMSQPPGFPPVPVMGANNFPATFGPMLPGMTQRAPAHENNMYGHQAPIPNPQQRQVGPTNGMNFPTSMSGMRQIQHGRSGPMELPVSPGLPGPNHVSQHGNLGQYGMSRDTMPSHSRSHSQQTSVSLDRSAYDTPSVPAQTQPIARPAPIQRPPSTTPQIQNEKSEQRSRTDIDDLANHLGSSALLDDTDVPLSSNNNPRRGSMAPGVPIRQAFSTSPMFSDPIGTNKIDNFSRGNQGGTVSTWSTPQMPFGAPPMSGPPQWSNTPGGPNRPNAPRAVTIRLLVCQACNKLSSGPPTSGKPGYHPIESVLRQVELMKPHGEGPITLQELLDICDTEGNMQNGGGSFIIESLAPNTTLVKFEQARNGSMGVRGAVPGDIGSPVPGGAFNTFSGARPFQQPGGMPAPSGF